MKPLKRFRYATKKYLLSNLVQDFEKELNDSYRGVEISESVYENLRNRFMLFLKLQYDLGKLNVLPVGLSVYYDKNSAKIVVDYPVIQKTSLVNTKKIVTLDKYWTAWTGIYKTEEPSPFTIWELTQDGGSRIFFALLEAKTVEEIHKEIGRTFDNCSFVFVSKKDKDWEPDSKSFLRLSEIKTRLYRD